MPKLSDKGLKKKTRRIEITEIKEQTKEESLQMMKRKKKNKLIPIKMMKIDLKHLLKREMLKLQQRQRKWLLNRRHYPLEKILSFLIQLKARNLLKIDHFWIVAKLVPTGIVLELSTLIQLTYLINASNQRLMSLPWLNICLLS